ncbi:MAG: thioesterase family protein [Thermocrispum sp.]
MTTTAPEQPVPFATASRLRPLGDGTFTATLRSEWSISGHPHGGFVVALIARAAMLVGADNDGVNGDPISVSAEFLRGTSLGPVLLRTEVRKVGRQTSVIAVHVEQRGRSCVEATVVIGRLPAQRAAWSDLPVMPAEPPANAMPLVDEVPGFGPTVFRLWQDCDVRLDSSSAALLARKPVRQAVPRDRQPPPRMRLWVRPRTAEVDVYFALLAGDVNPPMPYLIGRAGWSPTVQLTALVRGRPAPGWLRVQVDSRAVSGHWFDSDATVLDSTGLLVCQARQLAITPGP